MPAGPPVDHPHAFSKRINLAHSPLIGLVVPWLSIILASFGIGLFLIASAPLLPPLGFLMLIAWRQLRPGLLPVWSGFPLGLIDDLFSGQPVGSAVLLWSVTMLAMELIEVRFPWRSFITDWLVASALIMLYLILGLAAANAAGAGASLVTLVPQILLSVLIYPLAGRLVAWLDWLRLLRFKVPS